jgi:membrane protein implicated in regulation of membrane protease activity
MDRQPPEGRPSIRYVRVLVSLAVVAAAMCVLMWLSLDAASGLDGSTPEMRARRKGLYYIGWISLAMASLAAVLAVWVAMRWAKARSAPTEHIETPYVDAWSLAGKRLKVEDDEDDNSTDKSEGGNGKSPADEDDDGNGDADGKRDRWK